MPKPKNHSGKVRKKSSGDTADFPIIKIATLLGLTGMLAGAYFFSSSSAVQTNPVTLCAIGERPPSANFIVIDSTESFSAGERLQVINEITRLRDSLQRFALVEVFVIGDDFGVSVDPLISICNPGRGADMSELYQNPQLAEQRWQNGFRLQLEQTLDRAVLQSESDQSPIMETLKILGQAKFSDPSLDGVVKRLYLFSDLMQHTSAKYTQYQNSIDEFSRFIQTPFYSEVQVDLRGVESSVYYLQRPGTIQYQSPAHQRFWIQYLESTGSLVNSFKKLFGD
jgi:hypothetical protein